MLVVWTLWGGCLGPYPLPIGEDPTQLPPTCDGLLQPEEGVIDGPFDFDRDGFVDGSNPECAQTHGHHLLDCDDGSVLINPGLPEVECNVVDDDCDPQTNDRPDRDGDSFVSCEDCDDGDPQRNPDADEICWDGLDNDCDGQVDPGCPDYNGTFRIDPPVVYTCAFNQVEVVLDEFEMAWDPPDAQLDNLSGLKPPLLSGEIDETGAFVLEGAVVLGTAFSCEEYYRFTGRFLDEDTFTTQFEVVFVGDFCGSCVNQVFPDLSGTRY